MSCRWILRPLPGYPRCGREYGVPARGRRLDASRGLQTHAGEEIFHPVERQMLGMLAGDNRAGKPGPFSHCTSALCEVLG